MRNIYGIILMLMSFHQLYSQEEVEYVKLNKVEFEKLVYQNFTSIINSDNGGVLGNFASLSSDKNEIKFGATFIRRNEYKKFPAAITLNVRGGNDDNVLPIFSNNALSSFGVDLNAHILYKPSESGVEYDVEKQIYRRKARQKIINKYAPKLQTLTIPHIINDLRYNLADLQTKQKSDSASLDSLKKQITLLSPQVAAHPDSLELVKKLAKIKKDTATLRQEKIQLWPEKIRLTRDSLNALLNGDSTIFYDLESLMLTSRSKELSKVEEVKALGYKIKWVTISAGLGRSNFNLFDSSLPIADAVIKESHTMPSLGISFNSYSRGVFKNAFYSSAGAKWEMRNNLDSLSQVTIIDRTNYGANPNQSFSDKETKVYTGDYRSSLGAFRVYYDMYQFLDKNEIIAIHLNPNFLTISKKSILSTSLGAFISFKKKDKPESFLNAEVFYEFFDFANDLDQDLNLWQRGSAGLRVAFPINFKTNK